MSAPRPGGTSVRIPALDAPNRGNRVSLVIGPLELPSRAEVVDALVRIAREAPASPVAYRFDGPDRWALVSADREDWFSSFVEQIDAGPDELAVRAAELTAEAGAVAPIRIVLGRRHLLVSTDHALGDRVLLTGLPSAILRVVAGEPVADWLRERARIRLLPALLRTFALHPTRVLALLRDRGARTAAPVALGPDAPPPRPETVSTALDGGQLRALRAREHAHPGSVLGTALLLRLRAALAERGLPTRDEVVVVQDARRYFRRPPGAGSNPITGVPVATGSGEPERVGAEVRRAIELGRPLAALALGAATSAGRVPDPARRAALPGAARLTYSHVGQLRTFADLPWAPRSGPADILLTLGPLPVGAITLTLARLGEELHAAVSFDAATADRALVAAAVAEAFEPARAFEPAQAVAPAEPHERAEPVHSRPRKVARAS
ncbi:MAG: hypothetical protein J0G30_13210 [Actinomycetales bacterium]|nr:hypothetical protein [Actinomycetales bacterium]